MLEADPEIRPNALECLQDPYFFMNDEGMKSIKLSSGEELSKYRITKSRKSNEVNNITLETMPYVKAIK